MENDCNSSKCERCKSTLSTAIDEWENDFRFIEEAELQGNIYKLENFDGDFRKFEPGEDILISQAIKEEPEFQIEPDVIDEEQVIWEVYHVESLYLLNLLQQTCSSDRGDGADRTEGLQYQCSECAMWWVE